MRSTIITGGRGVIGSALVNSLRSDSEFGTIITLDNLSAGDHNEDKSDQFIYCDISNKEKLENAIRRFNPTYIFHLAAHFANQNSVDHPISDAQTNIIGTINLFEYLRRNNKVKKVVYASSSCVYGKRAMMSESDPIKMMDTPYAITKYSCEKYVEYYNAIHGIPSNIVRIFNTYGPGEVPGEYRNVVTNFIVKALLGQPLIITGNGEETRDFTFVTDTVDILKKAALMDNYNTEIFNGGTGVKTRIIDLAEMIIEATKSSSKIILSAARNWDHVSDRCSDITKSKTLLGYKPSVGLKEGLFSTIEWVKKLDIFAKY